MPFSTFECVKGEKEPVGSRSWGGWWSFHKYTLHWQYVPGREAHNLPHPLRSACSLGPRSFCLQFNIYHVISKSRPSRSYGCTIAQHVHDLSPKSNRGGVFLSLILASILSLLVWLTGHDKTLVAWINIWKLSELSSVILNKKHKRTWMQGGSTALYRKPVDSQESLAADCVLGWLTLRRTMTFVCPPKSRREKCRWSLLERMKCSRWGKLLLSEAMSRWYSDLDYGCMQYL